MATQGILSGACKQSNCQSLTKKILATEPWEGSEATAPEEARLAPGPPPQFKQSGTLWPLQAQQLGKPGCVYIETSAAEVQGNLGTTLTN